MLKSAFIASTAAAVLALGVAASASAEDKAAAGHEGKEKCYGIAKPGKNDCKFAGGSCAGTATEGNVAHAWVYVDKGTCEKQGGKAEGAAEEKK